MIKKREGYKIVILEPAKSRIARGVCPICEKPKADYTRRKDWICCSTECTEKHQKNYMIYGQHWLRLKVFERDNHVCKMCGQVKDKSELVADHIIAIALGGEEWSLDNVQTLCVKCNKVKTKEDAGKIAKLRSIDKILVSGQKVLNF